MDQRQRAELDRFITGNYGEDGVPEEPVLRANASINDCARLACDLNVSDCSYFDLVGPTGRIRAKWLDAYMGLLQIEGAEGFCMARDFDRPDIRCENFALACSADPDRAV